MGDSMIVATSLSLKAVCITDDQHIKQIKEIETAWIQEYAKSVNR